MHVFIYNMNIHICIYTSLHNITCMCLYACIHVLIFADTFAHTQRPSTTRDRSKAAHLHHNEGGKSTDSSKRADDSKETLAVLAVLSAAVGEGEGGGGGQRERGIQGKGEDGGEHKDSNVKNLHGALCPDGSTASPSPHARGVHLPHGTRMRLHPDAPDAHEPTTQTTWHAKPCIPGSPRGILKAHFPLVIQQEKGCQNMFHRYLFVRHLTCAYFYRFLSHAHIHMISI